MRTVDLDGLAKALREESRFVVSQRRGNELEWIACDGILVYSNGRIEFQKKGVDIDDLTAVIRHMSTLAPVAPDPGLREAIREAVKAGMLEEKDRLKDGSVKEIFDSTTKAVLAVLAERGVR